MVQSSRRSKGSIRFSPGSPLRLLVEPAERALAQIGVIALELLLRHQLGAEIGGLLAPLAVLAGAVIPAVERALGPAPEIGPEAPVDLVLRTFAFAHRSCCASVRIVVVCPNRPPGRFASAGRRGSHPRSWEWPRL